MTRRSRGRSPGGRRHRRGSRAGPPRHRVLECLAPRPRRGVRDAPRRPRRSVRPWSGSAGRASPFRRLRGGDLLDADVEPDLGEGRPGGHEDPLTILSRIASERPTTRSDKRRARSAYDSVRRVKAPAPLRRLAPGPRSRGPGRSRPRVRDAAVARRAGAADAAAGSRHDADGRHLDLHDLPARGLRGDPDRRTARGHVREEAGAGPRSRRSRRGNAPRSARDDAAGDDRRPHDSGARRRHLPALVRHHPRRVPPRSRRGGIALISGLLGIGGGLGIVLAGPILAHLDYHWLFWIPLVVDHRYHDRDDRPDPESPIRAPGSSTGCGAVLLTLWLVCLLLAISEAPQWGWLSAARSGCSCCSRAGRRLDPGRERGRRSPLVDMQMMRLRGVWTTNLVGFLIGVGMYSAFVLIPQFVQAPTSTGTASARP